MSDRDNKWLQATAAPTKGAWYVTISGFDGTTDPASASFLWPRGPSLTIPNKMVLLTVAAYADLVHHAQITSGQDGTP